MFRGKDLRRRLGTIWRAGFVTAIVSSHSTTGLANTLVKLGEVRQIRSAQDLDLDGNIVYAINFSPDDPVRTVRGVKFLPDNKPIPGATLVGPQNVVSWQTAPSLGTTPDDNQLEEILRDIRWANAGGGERLRATLAVTSGLEYKLQILISGNGPENRRWDIRVNGAQAVDEITSLGASPGQSYSANRVTLYTYQGIATTGTFVVEMGTLFGANEGGDRNPIWQALTLEKVTVPPTPAEITLDSTVFFKGQAAPVGRFQVTDLKGQGVTHLLELIPGIGDIDNAKFSIAGADLLAAPFDFSGEAPGSSYTIRVRATDTADANRFLERTLALSLQQAQPPAEIAFDAASVSASVQPGMLLGHLAATDPDTGDRHFFELVSGQGGDENASMAIAGNELRLAQPLSSVISQIRFRVRATDLAGLSVERALDLPVLAPDVAVNEVVASSIGAVLDEVGDAREWIELHNRLGQWVDLTGFHLTDSRSDLKKWKFPGGLMPPDGYLVVLADGLGVSPAGSELLHAGFSASSSGEWFGLVMPDGVTLIRELAAPEFFPGVAYGIGDDASVGYLLTPTPGKPNGPTSKFGANEVIFSRPHGFLTQSFPLELQATVPASAIRYTLDGTKPTPTTGTLYTGPILVTPNTSATARGARIVRALAIHSDAAYSPINTQTYLFIDGNSGPKVDGVVTQSRLFPSIRTNTTYGPLLADAFRALPAVSLIMATGPSATEQTASLELFDSNGEEEGFQINCGITVTGTTSLGSPKLSMAAKFKSDYGTSRLRYPIFARGSMFPDGAASSFKHLRLRSHSHDTFYWMGLRENPPVPYGNPPINRSGDALLTRNPWIDEMQLMMGQPGKHGRQVHLFLNGSYHGIYHIHEHPDPDFMASYYPGNAEQFHSTAAAIGGSEHGSGDSWVAPWSSLKASLANFTTAKRWVDVTNLCDYMILSFYAGNDWDWWGQHNWSAAGPKNAGEGGWKFFQQDSDVSFQDLAADCTDQDAPDGVFGALIRLTEFRVLFRDRVYKHCFNGGALTAARAGGLFEARMKELSLPLIAETARWQPSSSAGKLPWDRDEEWTKEWNYFRNTFFPARTARLLTQFRAHAGWWPVDPPTLSHYSGAVPPGFELTFSNKTGTVYFTTDGSDPRLPGGTINPNAQQVVLGTALPINHPTTVLARIKTAADWSAVVEVYLVPEILHLASAENLTISEIQYHPQEDGTNEFIEFLNTSDAPIDLGDVTLSAAVDFRFPRPTVLGPGERVVVVKDPPLFQARYQTSTSPYYLPEIRVAGSWDGSLANSAETIVVSNAAREPIFSCSYGSQDDWSGRADGRGSSLELIDPGAVPKDTPGKTAWLGDPLHWRPSAEFHGSPGTAGRAVDSRVSINEVFPGSVAPDTDAIELKNLTESALVIGGWFLSDSSLDYRKYRFPVGARIEPSAHVVFREADFNNAENPACLVPFALNSDGDDVFLLEADGTGALLRFVDRVGFGVTAAGTSVGRWPDGNGPIRQLGLPTLGGPNALPILDYVSWVAASFPPDSPATVTAADADPDGDGLKNFEEYGFVLPPLQPSIAPLKAGRLAADGEFTLSYRVRPGATDLGYRVDVSRDLLNWDGSGAQVQILGQTEAGDGAAWVLARLLPTADGNIQSRFVRVIVVP